MRHPTEGTLRRLLDEPAGVPDAEREHVAGCSHCLGGLASARDDASVVHTALTPAEGGPDLDVAAAWRRMPTAPARTERGRAARHRTSRRRSLLARPVVAALAAAVVLSGAGAAAANDWLQIFRTEQIAPVSFDTADLNALPDLRAYGDVAVTGDGDVHQVADATAAAAESGLDVPKVTALPRGVTGEPEYQVGGEVSATFTFSADRAARSGASSPPRELDGSRVRLVAGPGVAEVWSQPGGVPSLLVGRAVAPKAYSSGVPFEELRDYLLSLPGLPDDVAAELRTFNADGSTLPLPVPAEQVTTRSAQVNGQKATVLATRDRTMAAVVWVEDGDVTAVAGALDADEVLSIARKVR